MLPTKYKNCGWTETTTGAKVRDNSTNNPTSGKSGVVIATKVGQTAQWMLVQFEGIETAIPCEAFGEVC